jgi:hypothetical protein
MKINETNTNVECCCKKRLSCYTKPAKQQIAQMQIKSKNPQDHPQLPKLCCVSLLTIDSVVSFT